MRRMPFNAENLENFLFLSEDFNFQNEEIIQNASQDKLYFKIVNEIIKSSKNIESAPLIIFDKYNGNIYVGYVSDDTTAYATYTASNANSILEFEYHGDTDVLNIHLHDEFYVTADNIKTIFGQDITGTGDINLFVHHLLINANCYFTIYSSNNLKVDTPEKLTTLLKDKDTSVYYFGYQQTQYIYIAAISFNSSTNLWQIRVSGEETSYDITDISDIVTPI